MTPLPSENPEQAYHDAVNVVPTRARAVAALLRETSDRASGSCYGLLLLLSCGLLVPHNLSPRPLVCMGSPCLRQGAC